MIDRILQFKVNFVLLFGGALAIILLIKTTTLLLPAKYYFNFTKLVGGDSEPLLVDPPSVTGAKLCEVMARFAIPAGTFTRPVSCTANHENSLSAAQIDQLYSIALRSDQAVRAAFG